MSLNIPYNHTTFTLNGLTSYQMTVAQRNDFCKQISDYMIDVMGMPLEFAWKMGSDQDSIDLVNYYALKSSLTGTNILEFKIIGTANSTKQCTLGILSASALDRTVYNIGNISKSLTEVEITLRWIKSGESWFFGFVPAGYSASNNAWVNMACVPVRKASNPEQIVDYAIVFQTANNLSKAFYQYTTSNVDYTKATVTRDIVSKLLPQNTENTLMLLPVLMNVQDYYFDHVYISNVVGSTAQETTIETNQGTFLIAQGYGHSVNANYPSYLFEITDIVNEVLTTT